MTSDVITRRREVMTSDFITSDDVGRHDSVGAGVAPGAAAEARQSGPARGDEKIRYLRMLVYLVLYDSG